MGDEDTHARLDALTAENDRLRAVLTPREENVEAVAAAVLHDLLDRRGIKHELRLIRDEYPDTWVQLRAELGAEVLRVLSERAGIKP